jgi:2'-5' RNA ligase
MEDVRKYLRRQLDRQGIKIRWELAQKLHITSTFLGEVMDESLPAAFESLRQELGYIDPIPLSIQSLGVFPNSHRPRILWAGVHPTMLLAGIHQKETEIWVRHSIGLASIEKNEQKSFAPHGTLGRIRSRAPGLSSILAAKPFYFGTQTIDRLIVFESVLGLAGSIYKALETIRFLGRKN